MLIGALAQYFFGFTIFVLSSFLVLLVLVQRGRGGGLTGALGGPGGQSAFGTKAGDLFTRITIGVAAAWILLCATSVFMLRGRALPETGGVDRPNVKSDMGSGASSATTESGENKSVTPKIELPPLNQSPAGSVTPGAGAIQPAPTGATAPATETTTSPAAETPAATKTETTPPAATVPATETPASPEPPAPAEPK